MIRLYRHPLSGHSHRVRMLLSMLGLPHELVEIDLAAGQHKTPAFLARNPFGQVPVIEDGTVTLADSNAIMVYLASRYDPSGRWLPRDPIGAAQVQRWLSVAAGQLANGPGAARLVTVFGAKLDHERAKAIASQLFDLVDAALAESSYLAGDQPTIADLAIYSYTACAPEGGVALDRWRHLLGWLGRIEALPGFIPMQKARNDVAA